MNERFGEQFSGVQYESVEDCFKRARLVSTPTSYSGAMLDNKDLRRNVFMCREYTRQQARIDQLEENVKIVRMDNNMMIEQLESKLKVATEALTKLYTMPIEDRGRHKILW